jgi:hypothetical protein
MNSTVTELCMSSHPAILAEIKTFTAVSPDYLREILQDADFKAAENIQYHFKKKAEQDKKDNDLFFDALRALVDMEEYKNLISQIAALNQRIQQAIEERAEADKIRLNKELQDRYHAMLVPTQKLPLERERDHLSDLFAKWARLISQFSNLLRSIKQWYQFYWRPEVADSATSTASSIVPGVLSVLATDVHYKALLSAVDAHPHKAEIVLTMTGRQKQLQEDMAEALSIRAAPEELLSLVPELKQQFQAVRSQANQANNNNDVAAITTAVTQVLDPIYRLHEDINVVGNVYQYISDFKKLCAKYLGPEHQAAIRDLRAVALANKARKNPEISGILHDYHQKMRGLYDGHLIEGIKFIDLSEELTVLLKQLQSMTHTSKMTLPRCVPDDEQNDYGMKKR